MCEYKEQINDHTFYDILNSNSTHHHILEAIKPILPTCTEDETTELTGRIDVIIKNVKRFLAIVGGFVNSNPSFSRVAWGSIRRILEQVVESRPVTDTVTSALKKMAFEWSKLERLSRLFPKSFELRQSMTSLFASALRFWGCIIVYFRSHPIGTLSEDERLCLGQQLDLKMNEVVKCSYITERLSEVDRKGINKYRVETLDQVIEQNTDVDNSRINFGLRAPIFENPKFVGRSWELRALHRALSPSASANSRRFRSAVIHGRGGQGKSELAFRFAWLNRNSFDVVIRINSETLERANASLYRTAVDLGLMSMHSHQDEAQVRRRVHRALQAATFSWLVIFDNVPEDDLTVIRQCWPARSPGAVLVTTRSPDFARQFGATENILLGPLDNSSAVRLFTSSFHHPISPENERYSQSICRLLGNLPVALQQIAGCIVQTGCSERAFLEAYASYQSQVFVPASFYASSALIYHHTLDTVWSIALTAVTENSDDANELLALMSFLDTDGIPWLLFQNVPQGMQDLPSPYKFLAEFNKWHLALQHLEYHGFITVNNISRTVKLHRVLEERLDLDSLSTEQLNDAFVTAIKLLHHSFPSLEDWEAEGIARFRLHGEVYYKHIIATLKHYEILGMDIQPFPELQELIKSLFWYTRMTRLAHNTPWVYKTGFNVLEQYMDENLIHLADLHIIIGQGYRNSDKITEALDSFMEAYTLLTSAAELRQTRGVEESIAHTCMNIGLAIQQSGKYAEAQGWHDRGIEIKKDLYPGDVSRLLLPYISKAWGLWKLGMLDEAESLVDVLLDASGPWYGGTTYLKRLQASTLRLLGNIRIAQDRWIEAFDIHRESFDMQMNLYGPTHYETGIGAYRLGCHNEHIGEGTVAKKYFRTAIAIFENSSRDMVMQMIRAKYKLSCLLEQFGDHEAAMLLLEASDMRETLLGIPAEVSDDMKSYDSIVPYWSW